MSNDPMAEIRASFFVECEELLESLQDALNELDEGNRDAETINVVFRAVHSIKGGAGAFGLDPLVDFAHRFETVLDEVRAERLELTHDALKLFFTGADFLQDHVSAARDGTPPPEAAETAIKELEALLGEGFTTAEEEIDFSPAGLQLLDLEDLSFGASAEEPVADFVSAEIPTHPGDTQWTVEFTPTAELYHSGNEAGAILRTLAQLGTTRVTCKYSDHLPAPTVENAETPLLSWHVQISGDISRADIEQVFDFVSDICEIEIKQNGASEDGGDVSDQHAPKADASDLVDNADEKAATNVNEIKPIEQKEMPRPQSAAAVVALKGDQAQSKPEKEAASPTVRVDLSKIDRLVNLVGELVINQAMLSQSVEKAGLGSHATVTSGLESFMMLTRDIQDSVMMIRAQPVKPLFQRMGRIVREASASVGKEVRLKTEGEYTEVDKTVIERLSDPLTHMIRNAVDHGLEKPDVRQAAGKSREGVITLSASHRAGRVMIEIEDDGAGVNRKRVFKTARDKGLIAADAQLTDAEIDNLLFLPGFSTASEISALSGRGVGMDVVKSAITQLGGRISINSSAGRGTKFSISLPLTLAVLDGMVVKAADQTLVVPLSAIVETATLDETNVEMLGSSGALMQIRGEFVPIYNLAYLLGFSGDYGLAKGGTVLLTAQDDGKRAAIIVDSILEQRQVVIKGLGQSYGNIPGVAAATILGDGKIALILDPADLTSSDGAEAVVAEISRVG